MVIKCPSGVVTTRLRRPGSGNRAEETGLMFLWGRSMGVDIKPS